MITKAMSILADTLAHQTDQQDHPRKSQIRGARQIRKPGFEAVLAPKVQQC